MLQDQDRLKALLALKARLEKRIARLDTELAELKTSLDAVNIILLEKGFKRGNVKDAEQQAKEAQAAAKTAETATKNTQTGTVQPTKETIQPKEAKQPKVAPRAKPAGYQGGEPENVIPLKSIP
jgi:peptidoglycan hydrolase CwlO-like protein